MWLPFVFSSAQVRLSNYSSGAEPLALCEQFSKVWVRERGDLY